MRDEPILKHNYSKNDYPFHARMVGSAPGKRGSPGHSGRLTTAVPCTTH